MKTIKNPTWGIDVCFVSKVKMQDNQDKETSTNEVQREYKRTEQKVREGMILIFFGGEIY